MKKNFIIIFVSLIIPFKVMALIEVDITRGNLSPLPLAVSPLSIDKGETANGRGFKFPLVISTSIKAKAWVGIKTIKNNIIKFFFIFVS